MLDMSHGEVPVWRPDVPFARHAGKLCIHGRSHAIRTVDTDTGDSVRDDGLIGRLFCRIVQAVAGT